MHTENSLFDALLGRRAIILLMMVGSTVGAGLYLHWVPPLFRARASLMVPGDLPRVSLETESENFPEGPLVPDFSEETRVGVLGLIHSRSVREKAALQLGVPVAAFDKRVKADIDVDQQIVVVATAADPADAADTANAFLDAFRTEMRIMAERVPRQNLALLEGEEPEAWAAYAQARFARMEFLDSIQSPDPAVDMTLLLEERAQLTSSLQRLDIEEHQWKAQRPVLEQAVADRPEFAMVRRTVTENPAYRKALAAVADARTELEVLRLKYTDQVPEVQVALRKFQDAESLAEEEAARGLLTTSSEYQPDAAAHLFSQKLVELELGMAGIQPSRERLEARVQVVEASLGALPGHRSELAHLESALQRALSHAERVSQRIEELQLVLAGGLDFTYADEASRAVASQAQSLPHRVWTFVFALLAGLFAGIAAALVLEVAHSRRTQLPY